MRTELLLALVSVRSLARLAGAVSDAILDDARWASAERTEDQIRGLLHRAEKVLTEITLALADPVGPEEYTLSESDGLEPPPGHPAWEFGPAPD